MEKQEFILTKKPVKDALSITEKECVRMYGFVADPNKPIWENLKSSLKNLPTQLFLQAPYSLTCHNLCKKLQPPPGFNQLLGLSQNFCIEQYHPKPTVKETTAKLKRSIRLKSWIKQNGIEEDDYIKNFTYLHDGTHLPHLTK